MKRRIPIKPTYHLRPLWLELQLNPDPELPKRFGKRIRAIGGEYRAARGDTNIRFVYLPATRTGVALAAELIDAYPRRRSGVDRPVTIVRQRLIREGHVRIGPGAGLARWIAEVGRDMSAAKAGTRKRRREEQARAIVRRRASDMHAIQETSLEAGERLAAEFIFGTH